MSLEFYLEDLKPYICQVCHKGESGTAKLQRCSLCKVVRYCGVECQRKHWKQHKKGECEKLKKMRNFWIQDAQNIGDKNGTHLFIGATRVATELGDHALAVEMFERAANTNYPIEGGHPNAMVYAAYHYEHGYGVKQNLEKAFQLYQRVLSHSEFGGENWGPACIGLSRIHEEGIIKEDKETGSYSTVVEKNTELATKYKVFSQSNPETDGDVKHLEQWWNENRDKFMEQIETS